MFQEFSINKALTPAAGPRGSGTSAGYSSCPGDGLAPILSWTVLGPLVLGVWGTTAFGVSHGFWWACGAGGHQAGEPWRWWVCVPAWGPGHTLGSTARGLAGQVAHCGGTDSRAAETHR